MKIWDISQPGSKGHISQLDCLVRTGLRASLLAVNRRAGAWAAPTGLARCMPVSTGRLRATWQDLSEPCCTVC